jgi:hypothetical protein
VTPEDHTTDRRMPSGIAWQWVPVRLDLHQRLTESAEGEVTAAGQDPAAEREHILRLLREESVPALYSSGEQNLQLMVPVHVQGELTLVARASLDGQLSLGSELNDVMEAILAYPGLEYASWQTGPGVPENPTAVATIEADRARLARWLSRAGFSGRIEVADAGRGWTLVSAETYPALLEVVDAAAARAVVLDTDGEHRAATYCPVQGEPVSLEWGPIRDAVTSYPVDSPADVLQAQVGGQSPSRLRDAARVAGVAALTDAFGLDAVGSRRLERYARDASGRYAPESALQLLGVPDIAAKVIDGRKLFADQPGHERLAFSPRRPGTAGEALPAVREAAGRALGAARRNPWTVVAAAGLGVGAWIARRKR